MTHSLINIIQQSISRHSLIPDPSRPVVVALSGGADSVALLSALVEMGYNCVAAHCNFHLRGEESNRDMRLCQKLCSSLKVDLYVRDFNVEVRRKSTGESLEMACRSLRYEWFDSLLERLRAQAIAVAHHSQDNEETLLINLLRGSSLSGLTGMKPRHGFVIRPMLQASRQQIIDFLEARSIPFVVDSSNLKDDFVRNRIRHHVLPAMREAVPDADRGLLASLDFLSQNREFYEQQIRHLCTLYRTENRISLAQLLSQEPHARIILFEMLKPMGFNMSQIDNILNSAASSGLSFTSATHKLELSRGSLSIFPLSPSPSGTQTVEVSLKRDILQPRHIIITEHDISEFHPTRDPNIAYFDISILDDLPTFEIRPWKRADRFMPFGMKSTQLLSDTMRDARYDAHQKRSLRLLTRNGLILWAIGLRPSALFTITPSTRRFLKLTLKDR